MGEIEINPQPDLESQCDDGDQHRSPELEHPELEGGQRQHIQESDDCQENGIDIVVRKHDMLHDFTVTTISDGFCTEEHDADQDR